MLAKSETMKPWSFMRRPMMLIMLFGPGRGARGVVERDHPADRHARMHVGAGDGGREVVAADIVEIDVDALRGGLVQGLGEALEVAGGAVVDGFVEADGLQVVALVLAARGTRRRGSP